jgi:sugar-phosphatase
MSHESKIIEIQCAALLFDLDGVLIDSHLCIEHHWRLWADHHRLDLEEVLSHAHGRRTAETIRIVAPHLDADAEAEALDAEEAVDTNRLMRVDGAARLIHSIPGGAWAVVTSGPRVMAVTRLTFAGLPVPSVLITGQDVSRGKPDPEPYLAAADRLRLSPSTCVVVEDAPAGIQSARSAGMRVVAVASTHPAADLAQADFVTRRLGDIDALAQHATAATGFRIRVKTV